MQRKDFLFPLESFDISMVKSQVTVEKSRVDNPSTGPLIKRFIDPLSINNFRQTDEQLPGVFSE